MLYLGLREGESIRIGETIVVTVTEIAHGRVRLGVTAPAAVPVWRDELWAPGRPSNAAGDGTAVERGGRR